MKFRILQMILEFLNELLLDLHDKAGKAKPEDSNA